MNRGLCSKRGEIVDTSLFDYCKQNGTADVLAQWHPTKNEPLSPDQVTFGSKKKAWWICEKGHEWQAQIKSRAYGSGCPVCTNRKTNPGENDLATSCPELAQQWHPTLNGELTPKELTFGSRKIVWWICEKGHEWQAPVYSRTGLNTGCPVCAGKVIIPGENDLAAAFPALALQWHPERNGTMTPQTISPYSNRKVWWVCEKGHEWQAIVGHRTQLGSKCPVCTGRKILAGFNDLATVHPAIAAQWHPTLNKDLTPEMVGVGSNKQVWWLCDYGHVWKAAVYSRTSKRKHGCPICAGTQRQSKSPAF